MLLSLAKSCLNWLSPSYAASGKAYRPDIDGLRSIAVIAVLLFHANIQAVKGGFVGVDVFFVISGYLITGILARDLAKPNFTVREYISAFYERRARRIFPALFTVFAASTVAAWLILFPTELRDFGASLASATLFVSNMYFLGQQNYFAAPAEIMPLLHTWSLAVEEQFYIFFPLILLAVAKFGEKRYRSYTVLIAVASFILSAVMVKMWMPGAFFLALPRAWELLIGSMLALGTFSTIGQGRKTREVLGLLGLALIGYSVFVFQKITPFPGFAALAPTVGAALIIHAGSVPGSKTLTTRLLSLRPAVFIGLISYSLYLWHAPMLVFCKIAYTQLLPRTEKVLLILAIIAIATLSWWFVERPFRNRNFLTRKQIFALSAACMALFTGVGAAFYYSGGMESRYPANIREMAAYTAYDTTQDSRDGKCFLSSTFNDINLFQKDLCLAHSTEKPNWLLLGDSHAAHYYQGLLRVFPGANIMQATSSGCKPVLKGEGSYRCTTLRDDMFQNLIPSGKVDVIILAARWAKEDLPLLVDTVQYLKQFNKPVYVIGPIVEYTLPVPRLLATAAVRKDPNLLHNSMADSAIRPLDAKMEQALQGSGATYLSAYRTFCKPGVDDSYACATTTTEGVPLQFDYGHLTRAGAIWAMTQWQPQLSPALQVHKESVKTTGNSSIELEKSSNK